MFYSAVNNKYDFFREIYNRLFESVSNFNKKYMYSADPAEYFRITLLLTISM